MLAKKQADLVLVRGLQRCSQSAPRTSFPLRHPRQALDHGLDDLGISTVERQSQEILPVLRLSFGMKIG